MLNCPSCNSEVEESSIFCYFCGYNLSSDSLIKKGKIAVQAGDQLTLSASALDKYLDLEKNIQKLAGIENELAQQTRDLQHLTSRLAEIQARFQESSAIRYKEFQDVQKLKNLTATSLFARIKGDREDKIQKEEIEYFDALNKEAALEAEVQRLLNLKAQTEKQLQDLNALNQRKTQYQTQLQKLIHEVCEGVADPVEDQIEKRLTTLQAQSTPLEQELNRLERGASFLKNTSRDLEDALDRLGGASGLATWDTFFGGGLFVDSMKHSRMAEARNAVYRAQQSIQSANREVPEMRLSSHAYVEELSFFWDGFMDNIFSDLSARGKIERSRNSVQQAYNETLDMLNWLDKQIREKAAERQTLAQQIQTTHQDLLRERRRMIEEAIAASASKKA